MTLSVAVVLPSFAGGGAERVTLTLLDHLDRARFRPSLVVIDGRGSLRTLVPSDIEIHDLAAPRLRTAFPGLVRVLRGLAPEVVFRTMVHVNLALLAARPLLAGRPRLVVREANTPSRSLASTAHPRLMRALYRRLMPRAEAVLCNSRLMADEIADEFAVPAARIVHLPNPVEIGRLRATAQPPLRKPGPGRRFAAAGRLTRQKGFDCLLEMLAEVDDAFHLTLFGTGPDEVSLRREAVHLDVAENIDFAGFSDSPWAAVAGADAFLLPSSWEGMPDAALEALAVGTPVIATPEASGIGELAALAPPGAVMLAEAGVPFTRAMAACEPAPPEALRPSLLPEGFEPEAIGTRLAAVLESDPSGPSARPGGSR